MEFVWQEIRHALRRLLSAGGFTVATVLLLGLGSGAATAIFSVVQAVLLKALIPGQDRVVVMHLRDPSADSPFTPISLPDFLDWRDATTSFEVLAAFGMSTSKVSLGLDGKSLGARAVMVTPSFFDVVGQKPHLGRGFLPGEERPEAERVVVLSYGLWQQAFGGDEGILGTRITLDGGREPYTIVGVMPPGFAFPNQVRIWIIARNESPIDERGWSFLLTVGRLASGVTAEQARSEMALIDTRVLEETRKVVVVPRRIETVPVMDFFLGKNTRSSLWILEAAVGLLLLIACANVTGLFLARTASRHREVAIRIALGASRGQLVRAFLAEASLVSLAGGVLGVVLARAALTMIVALGPFSIPRLSEAKVDLFTLAFTVLVVGAAALLVGLVSVLVATRRPPAEALSAATRSSVSPGRSRLRQSFILFEVAVTALLLIGASLMINSLMRLMHADLGYRPEQLLLLRVDGPMDPVESPRAQRALMQDLMTRVEALGDVASVGTILRPPLREGRGGWDWWFVAESQGFGFVPYEEVDSDTGETLTYLDPPPEAFDQNPPINWQAVSGSYFRTMGIPLLRGRTFTENDTEDAPRVVIVGKSFAERLWPGEDAIGKRIISYGYRYDEDRRAEWQTVVGLVADARYQEIDRARLDVYVPYQQSPLVPGNLVVRTIGEPLAVIDSVSNIAKEIDPELQIGDVRTMETVIDRELMPWRFNTTLLTVFAGSAFFLAALGVFGLVAHSVTQRTHEIGLRMALGARAEDVLRLIVREGMRVVLAGLVGGLGLAYLSARVLSAYLYEVAPTDPATYLVVGLLITVVALLSCYFPARRAARLDPAVVLRAE